MQWHTYCDVKAESGLRPFLLTVRQKAWFLPDGARAVAHVL